MDAISYKQYLILLIITLFIISCSDDSDPVRQETRGWSVQKIYTAANAATEKGSYSRAIKLYQILQYTYPYGIYNQQSLLELAYTYYQDDQPELALPILDQFINTYPTNANVDYALYLKGYINYKNDNGLLSNFTGQDLSERDPTIIFTSYTAFQKLLAEYPHSKFAPDARDKINRLINALSRAEIYHARYYMTIKAYLAAIKRANNVITKYPNTPWVEEALAIEILAYNKLGSTTLSQSVQQVLQLNFPNSIYLRHFWANQDIAWYAFWR